MFSRYKAGDRSVFLWLDGRRARWFATGRLCRRVQIRHSFRTITFMLLKLMYILKNSFRNMNALINPQFKKKRLNRSDTNFEWLQHQFIKDTNFSIIEHEVSIVFKMKPINSGIHLQLISCSSFDNPIILCPWDDPYRTLH